MAYQRYGRGHQWVLRRDDLRRAARRCRAVLPSAVPMARHRAVPSGLPVAPARNVASSVVPADRRDVLAGAPGRRRCAAIRVAWRPEGPAPGYAPPPALIRAGWAAALIRVDQPPALIRAGRAAARS
ncbi:hypothetical protein AB0M35_13655 [Micromonospora sp. NPDC051196]|uniref:hypothetical protein n=1 Tax=Micromonospora sp. NPDC051196 TaxID=3155281 RepID=UPI003446B0DA